MHHILLVFFFFFFNDTATTEIYTLSLHDALPISSSRCRARCARGGCGRPRVLLSVEELERSFGGVRALDGAAVQVSAGEVHGLIGPNGAGKTTLLNVISGLFRPSRGRIVLGGERIDGLPPNRIAALGITRTYQNIRLFPGLSALENVLVGAHLVRREDALRRMLFLPSARADEVRAREAALQLLARVGLRERAQERVSSLSYGDQRRV